jgi:hypothetical protein
MRGFSATDLPDGTRYVALHYTADEEKQGEWVAAASKGVPEREWKREMELREDVWDGEPVFADYRDGFHAIERSIKVLPECYYIGGWDAGDTLAPAFILKQLRPILSPNLVEYRAYGVLECVPTVAMPMETFAPWVRDTLNNWAGDFEELPKKIIHVGDQTITTRQGARGETAEKVAAEFGFNIRPMTNDWEVRRSAVTNLLVGRVQKDRAQFIISATDCPVLRKGFQGAYKYEAAASGDQSGHGMVRKMPLKNSYSHIQDANQYADMFIHDLMRELLGSGSRVKQSSRIVKRSNYRVSQ